MIIIEKREKQDGLFLRIPIYGDRILQKTAKYYSDSSMRLMTTSAEISRLAASGITRLFLL
ncbi:MAG: hypothetical protein ACOCO4_01465, partial [Segatella copri]